MPLILIAPTTTINKQNAVQDNHKETNIWKEVEKDSIPKLETKSQKDKQTLARIRPISLLVQSVGSPSTNSMFDSAAGAGFP